MLIFIQALPLSLSTFWRYLILLPFLAIGALALSLFSFIPFFGLLVPGMVAVWMNVMGLRCALSARGYTQPIDWGTLFTVCLYFSVIFALVGFVLNGATWGILQIMEAAGIDLDPIGVFAGLFGVSAYRTATLFAILAPVAIVSAAFAVPLTAAAASTVASGWDYKAFAGFGRGVVGLLLVSAVWLLGGHMFSIFGEIWTVLGLMAGAVMALAQGESLPFQTDLAPWTALRGVLIMAWASSWYFATAVLTWERFANQPSDQVTASAQETTQDIRALRLARMRENNQRR